MKTSESKKEKYENLRLQIDALIAGETNLIAKLANISAAIKFSFNFFWVGFYLLEDEQLVLGPFQGPIACNRINLGKGVCGKAFLEKRSIIVPDVDQFEGHIACNSASKSEIVIPFAIQGKMKGVLDVDSEKLNCFDDVDQFQLKKILESLAATAHA